MSSNLSPGLSRGVIVLLVLIICFLFMIIYVQSKDGLYWKGEIYYLNSKFQEALAEYEQAITLVCPTKDNCFTQEKDVRFFCAAFRASARLYVSKPSSATLSTIAKKYWDDLARRFPAALDQCLRDAEEEPYWNKMKDEERNTIRKLINQPPYKNGTLPTPTHTLTLPTRTATIVSAVTITPAAPTLSPPPSSRPCISTGYRLYGDPILLHARIERAPSIGIPRVFGNNWVTINWSIAQNVIVCLASSSDGQGKLSVDDQIDLKVSRGGKITSWVLNFYDPNTKGIGEYPPQDITWMFGDGTNLVDVSLQDTKEDHYYAWPLWLVMWQR